MKRHFMHLSRNIVQKNSPITFTLSRYLSTKEAIERRNHLFSLEKKRQLENVGRIEKIEVKYKGVPKDCTLIMNKDISTPHDCAKHLSEWHAESSALALIDGAVHWDMHRPLTENCTLEFQSYNSSEPQQVNKAFWRTCSFLLGAVATQAFKDTVEVKLHSFPGPDIRSGSFIYDAALSLPSWQPSPRELHTLSAEFVSAARRAAPLERLEVTEALAAEMFVDNPFKREQIPSIAAASGLVTLYRWEQHVDISRGPLVNHAAHVGRVAVTSVHKLEGLVTLYRWEQHVDISRGPLVNHAAHVGRVAVTSVHKLEGSLGGLQLYRFQGVALPAGVILNHFAFTVLTERAKKLNPARSPLEPWDDRAAVRA